LTVPGIQRLTDRAAEALRTGGIDPEASAIAIYVPGRIEVLGKHTDYCGGQSLIAAVQRGICFLAVPRADTALHVYAPDMADSCAFDLSPDIEPAAGHWSNYPMTVARRVARDFSGDLRGAAIAYCGDLPCDAGLSSSSAVLTGIFLAISRINNLPSRREYRDNIPDLQALAAYLGAIENGSGFASLEGDSGVGTFGGSEDHTAILNALDGRLSLYSYSPVRLDRNIPLGEEWTFAVAASGVPAPKTGAAMEKYNRVARRASAILKLWREKTGRDDPHLAAAVASGPDAAGRMRDMVSRSGGCGNLTADELVSRLDQFVAENCEIIPAA